MQVNRAGIKVWGIAVALALLAGCAAPGPVDQVERTTHETIRTVERSSNELGRTVGGVTRETQERTRGLGQTSGGVLGGTGIR